MKNRVSYKEFQRRQKLAEADYQIAERVWQRDIQYIKQQGVKKTLIDEVKGQVAPPDSLLGRLINPSKRKKRGKKSFFNRLLGSASLPTYDSLTQGSGQSASDSSSNGPMQRAINAGLALAKPILWTVGLGMAKGYLRRKFKPLRFFIR